MSCTLFSKKAVTKESKHLRKGVTDSFLKPISKSGNDHYKLNAYRILTVPKATGNLMERIVARKLAIDLEERRILPAYLCAREGPYALHAVIQEFPQCCL